MDLARLVLVVVEVECILMPVLVMVWQVLSSKLLNSFACDDF